MEVDFEVVDEDGDNIEGCGTDDREMNRVALHIPYAHLGEAPEHDYFPTAYAHPCKSAVESALGGGWQARFSSGRKGG